METVGKAYSPKPDSSPCGNPFRKPSGNLKKPPHPYILNPQNTFIEPGKIPLRGALIGAL